jgi:transcriptional regulator with PAS, ATPase and Fis domain
MRKASTVIKMREQENDNSAGLIKEACEALKKSAPPPVASALMPIQKTIQHFATLLANVLHLEVEVVDNQLLRIAGTGPYGQGFGQVPASNTVLLREVLEKGQEVVIFDSRQNSLCLECTQRESCRERGFVGVPVMYQERCLGVISLVAVNIEQLRHLREHTRMFIEYIHHISSLLAANLSVFPRKESAIDPLLQSLAQCVDQAVIVCDRQGKIVLINVRAQMLLGAHADLRLEKLRVVGVPARERTYQVQVGNQRWRITGQVRETEEGTVLAFSDARSEQRDGPGAEAAPVIKSLIGDSSAMRKLKRLIARIASSPSSVMILGESGTGKEVVARAVHRLSERHDKAFVAINCAAIPENLLESELFGYAKGAFTGAAPGGKRGLIQIAHGGTLFLDEIGDMPSGLQARLLRAIESREVMPIGASVPVPVDIRIISATHQNLENHIRDGSFREDLYYRLNVIPLWLPPLRERDGDIELLLKHFLTLHAGRVGRLQPGVSPQALRMLRGHRWPGNVRELSNLVEYLINIVPEGEIIDSALLPPVFHSSWLSEPPPVMAQPVQETRCESTEKARLKSVEKTLIEEALMRTRNKKQVADELGIGVATLYRKIKKYGLAG